MCIYIQNKWCTVNCSPPTDVQPVPKQLQPTKPTPHSFQVCFFLCRLLFFVCLFVCFCMMPDGMEYPSGQRSSAVLVLPPPSSFCPRSCPHWQDSTRNWKTETFLALCSTAQQQLKHCCVIKIVFLTKPKHSTMREKSVLFQMKPWHCGSSFNDWSVYLSLEKWRTPSSVIEICPLHASQIENVFLYRWSFKES